MQPPSACLRRRAASLLQLSASCDKLTGSKEAGCPPSQYLPTQGASSQWHVWVGSISEHNSFGTKSGRFRYMTISVQTMSRSVHDNCLCSRVHRQYNFGTQSVHQEYDFGTCLESYDKQLKDVAGCRSQSVRLFETHYSVSQKPDGSD